MYNKQYFIEKFSKIPGGEIGRCSLEKHCALFHCGVTLTPDGRDYVMTEEATALGKLLVPLISREASPETAVWQVNDHCDQFGMTPKERILNALAQLPD